MIVEHKGVGHPDTLTDNIVEVCSKTLDAYYLQEFGHIKHYNVDKALFLAGECVIDFGSLEKISDPTFILGGRISNLDEKLKNVLTENIQKYVKTLLPKLEFAIEIRSSNVSKNLNTLSENNVSNDTSFAVGFYPFNEEEQIVLTLSKEINQARQHLPIGTDFKIMLYHNNIVISVPVFYDKVKNFGEYLECINRLHTYLQKYAPTYKLTINPEKANNNVAWLTYAGSSIENGDDGQVGRGNRLNGLITPNRPMTLEAFAGKNNRNHIGKLYQTVAQNKAKELYEETQTPVQISLVNMIGNNIDEFLIETI